MDCFQNIDETIVIIPSIMNDYEMYVLNNETAADDLFFNYYDNAVSEYNKILNRKLDYSDKNSSVLVLIKGSPTIIRISPSLNSVYGPEIL